LVTISTTKQIKRVDSATRKLSGDKRAALRRRNKFWRANSHKPVENFRFYLQWPREVGPDNRRCIPVATNFPADERS
jgi:hypothetical protein